MLTTHPPWSKYEGHAALFKIGNGEKPEYELPLEASENCRKFLHMTFQQNVKDRPSSSELLEHPFIRN